VWGDTVEKVAAERINARFTQSRFKHGGESYISIKTENFARVLLIDFFNSIGALETLAAASPTGAAVVMRRDASTSVAPFLLDGAGSALGWCRRRRCRSPRDQP
jgi:hypothetical protein